jgi:hypothetical protein
MSDSSGDKSQSSGDQSYGAGSREDAPFPALDFPGTESLQGLERRRKTQTFERESLDRRGALGSIGVEIVGDCSLMCCVVVWECVEQSELFPGVCNLWEPIFIGC